MKILITGDRGFVGREFHRQLDDKHSICGIDTLNGWDARDFFREDRSRFDLVIHLAAVVGGRTKIEGSPLDVAENLSIDADMFQWARKTKPGRIVYFSSSAAYPIELQSRQFEGRKLVESDIDLMNIKNPDQSYGWSKLTGEVLAMYAKSQGLKVHVVRPFSGYGSDQSLEYPFPSFIYRAMSKQKPFTVWGSGRQRRDWIHISDIVKAVMLMVHHAIFEPINLCTGRGTSFIELAEIMLRNTGQQVFLDIQHDKPSGVFNRIGNPTRMLSFFKPEIELEDGIRQAILDFRAFE